MTDLLKLAFTVRIDYIRSDDRRKQDGGSTVEEIETVPKGVVQFDRDADAWCRKVYKLTFSDPEDKILECEVCHSHICAKCLKLNPVQYETMDRDYLIW